MWWQVIHGSIEEIDTVSLGYAIMERWIIYESMLEQAPQGPIGHLSAVMDGEWEELNLPGHCL